MKLKATPLDLGLRRMIELSTKHLTQEDQHLIRSTYAHAYPRIVLHQCGAIVFLERREFSDDQVRLLKLHGFSDPFIAIFRHATTTTADVRLINFTTEAEPLSHLPVF
jgi:hypothetical protein